MQASHAGAESQRSLCPARSPQRLLGELGIVSPQFIPDVPGS